MGTDADNSTAHPHTLLNSLTRDPLPPCKGENVARDTTGHTEREDKVENPSHDNFPGLFTVPNPVLNLFKPDLAARYTPCLEISNGQIVGVVHRARENRQSWNDGYFRNESLGHGAHAYLYPPEATTKHLSLGYNNRLGHLCGRWNLNSVIFIGCHFYRTFYQ